MVWEKARLSLTDCLNIDFNSSLDGLGGSGRWFYSLLSCIFQFQFGWFGSSQALIMWFVNFNFNSSLDGLGAADF